MASIQSIAGINHHKAAVVDSAPRHASIQRTCHGQRIPATVCCFFQAGFCPTRHHHHHLHHRHHCQKSSPSASCMDGQTVINKGKRKKKHDMSTISHAGFPPRAQAEDAVSQRGNYYLKQYHNTQCYKYKAYALRLTHALHRDDCS